MRYTSASFLFYKRYKIYPGYCGNIDNTWNKIVRDCKLIEKELIFDQFIYKDTKTSYIVIINIEKLLRFLITLSFFTRGIISLFWKTILH